MNRKPSTLPVPCRNRWQHYQASHSSIIHHSFSQAVHGCLCVYLCVFFLHSVLLGEVTLRRLAVKQVYTLKLSCRISGQLCFLFEMLPQTLNCIFKICMYLKVCSAKCKRKCIGKTYHEMMMDAMCQLWLLWTLRLLNTAQRWCCLSKLLEFPFYSLYPSETLEERKRRCVVSVSTHHFSPSL